MPRPTTITADVIKAIAADVANGIPPHIAAEANGVSKTAHYTWLQRAIDPDENPLYAEYRAAIERARAAATAESVKTIRAAALQGRDGSRDPDWRAHAWLLERSARKDFGVKVEVTQRVEATFTYVLDRLRAQLDPATYGRVVEAMSSALAGAGEVEADAADEPLDH